MKKTYHAPKLEIELYALDASIASNCHIVVKIGPAAPGYDPCAGFDIFGDESSEGSVHRYSKKYNVTFYDDSNCDCYTTGGNSGYWVS